MKVLILKKRKDFIRAANGIKSVVSGLILQAAQNLSCPDDDTYFLGYTATKKIGKAHLRNRTKRRLRAAAAQVFPLNAKKGISYVLIGRYNTATIPFETLKSNMLKALQSVNKQMDQE